MDDEAGLVACGFVQRNERPFSVGSDEMPKEWRRVPSKDRKFSRAIKDSRNFKYESAYCESVLQRVADELLPDEKYSEKRCSVLATDRGFAAELRGEDPPQKPVTKFPDTAVHFCGPLDAPSDSAVAEKFSSDDYVKVACGALRKNNSKAYDPDSDDYQSALNSLGKRCGPDTRRSRSSSHIDTSSRTVEREIADDDGDDVQYIRLAGTRGAANPCAQQAARVLTIQPSAGYTFANALVALAAVGANTYGQVHRDNLTAQLLNSQVRANTAAGYGSNVIAGQGFWGQGLRGPTQFGAPGYGGACGYPPMQTNYTGCIAGQPGIVPVGGGCGGSPQIVAGPAGLGGQNIGGGILVPIQGGGYPGGGCSNTGAGPLGYPGSGCPTGNCFGPAGFGNGQYAIDQFGNPIGSRNPYASTLPNNPFDLDRQRLDLENMQNRLSQQVDALGHLRDVSGQLSDLDRERNKILQDYNSAQGDLARNQIGLPGSQVGGSGNCGFPGCNPSPCSAGGNCGINYAQMGYPGILMSGVPAGGPAGVFNQSGGCGTPACSPGLPGYYAPPMIVGNGGYGNPAFGFPQPSSSLSLGVRFGVQSALPNKNVSGSAR